MFGWMKRWVDGIVLKGVELEALRKLKVVKEEMERGQEAIRLLKLAVEDVERLKKRQYDRENEKYEEGFNRGKGEGIRIATASQSAAERVEERLEQIKMLSEEVRYQLGKVDEGDPLWIAVRKVVAGALRDAEAAAKIPGLSDGDRHFNVGRCGGMEDVLALLESVRVEARREQEEQAKAA